MFHHLRLTLMYAKLEPKTLKVEIVSIFYHAKGSCPIIGFSWRG